MREISSMAIETAAPRPTVERPRVDIREKVTGAARYVEDIPDLPGTVYAAAVRSPFSHAGILSIDSLKARAVPGVLAVMDRDSLGEYDVHLGVESHANVIMTHHQLIATDRARFDGDIIDELEWGDVEQGLREADYVYEGVFTSPNIYHHPIEPAMSVLVNYTADGIEVWTQSNQPFDVASDIAALMGIRPEQVRVHVP
jgi:CO/xanthine dehydrogenase Mo-binding subunit